MRDPSSFCCEIAIFLVLIYSRQIFSGNRLQQSRRFLVTQGKVRDFTLALNVVLLHHGPEVCCLSSGSLADGKAKALPSREQLSTNLHSAV